MSEVIQDIVWLSKGETPDCFAGAGMPGPWGETVAEAISLFLDQTAATGEIHYRRIGDTLFLSNTEFSER